MQTLSAKRKHGWELFEQFNDFLLIENAPKLLSHLRKVVDGRIHSEANYAVLRTKLSDASTVFNVGRYIDTVVRADGGLKFASRECIYDSEMIPNSIIYPI